MISLSNIQFVVVDVETTGMRSETNRITEIACCVVRNGEIQHKFSSLVNPKQFIPPMIEQLTGITNAMVYNAPEERDVFKEVYNLLMLDNAVFVAHNEQFDWSFVSSALTRSGLPIPKIERLCTCKLARRLLPKKRKKNLGSVASYYSVQIDGRHRAYGDAEATARVLIEMMDTLEGQYDVETLDDVLTFQNKRFKNFHATPRSIKRLQPLLDTLPSEPGVYYMKDSEERIMYVGKAKSLSDRVRSYFTDSAQLPQKIADMVRQVHTISFEETGTELGALLLESKEIKRIKPPFNTMSKKLRRYPFLKITNEDYPRLELAMSIEEDGAEYYGPFPRRGMVEEILTTIKQNFHIRLCNDPLEPKESFQPCFYYHIKRCNAPCSLAQSKQDYLAEIDLARKFLSGYSQGIIATLEHDMHECAERLEFETAAMLRNRIKELKKLFERSAEVSSAVNNTNLVLILPTDNQDKTSTIFCLRAGMLVHQETIGAKADLGTLTKQLFNLYSSGEKAELPLTPYQVDELRIITQWMYRQRNSGTFIYTDSLTHNELVEKVTYAIRNTKLVADEPETNPINSLKEPAFEYSQIDESFD